MLKKILIYILVVIVRALNPRLVVSSDVFFRGLPSVKISKGASIVIEDGCVINSLQYRYHVHMNKSVYLFSEGEGAMVRIGRDTRVHGSCIHALQSIDIGSRCLIAANCQIIDSNGHELSFDAVQSRINTRDGGKSIIIGNDVWIGCNSILLGDTQIGDGSVVMAGSVVKGKFPSMAIIGGNPARVLKSYDLGDVNNGKKGIYERRR